MVNADVKIYKKLCKELDKCEIMNPRFSLGQHFLKMQSCLRNTTFDFSNVKLRNGLMKDQKRMSLNHSCESEKQKSMSQSHSTLPCFMTLYSLVHQLNSEVMKGMNHIFDLCIPGTLRNI